MKSEETADLDGDKSPWEQEEQEKEEMNLWNMIGLSE